MKWLFILNVFGSVAFAVVHWLNKPRKPQYQILTDHAYLQRCFRVVEDVLLQEWNADQVDPDSIAAMGKVPYRTTVNGRVDEVERNALIAKGLVLNVGQVVQVDRVATVKSFDL